MGREIRMVPANWEHPRERKFNVYSRQYEDYYIPMYDRPYIQEMEEWIDAHFRWECGEHADQKDDPEMKKYLHYAEWAGNPPDVKSYRPNWKKEEMTWFQAYETVSEGTPVTPPFATKQELIEYLVKHGDFWDQKRREERANGKMTGMPCDPWTREQAEAFVAERWAPTMVMNNGAIQTGIEHIAATRKDRGLK